LAGGRPDLSGIVPAFDGDRGGQAAPVFGFSIYLPGNGLRPGAAARPGVIRRQFPARSSCQHSCNAAAVQAQQL